MKGKFLVAGLMGAVLLAGAVDSHAKEEKKHVAKWVKMEVEVPNQNLDSDYYDVNSIKVLGKSLYWTEKFVLTDFGSAQYTKHLKEFPACKQAIEQKGPAAYHQMDFEIKEGQLRPVAKRNYTKDNKLLCSDKDMNNDLNTAWQKIKPRSAAMERYYLIRNNVKGSDI
jgi:hypothetical protein